MLIAICSTGKGLDSPVEDRFGRAPYLILVDENGNHIQTLTNDSTASPQGAGIATAQLMINNQVDTVLTGKVGPKAIKPLQSAGIKVYTGISGTVSNSFKEFKQGKLIQLDQANSQPHGGVAQP